MNVRRIAVALSVVALLISGMLQFRAAAQERPREDALLVEVRGLRAAIEHLASVGARVQLTTSRLQMQEQRVNLLISRLAGQRDRVPPVERELAALQERVAGTQREIDGATDPKHRRQMEYELKHVQGLVAQHTAELRRLQTEEAEVANLLATEQARWADVNRQLEQLDAALRK